MQANPTPSHDPIAKIVGEIWQQHDGDMPGATSTLYGRVTQDQALLSAILPSMVMAWCRDRIGNHVGALRLAAMPSTVDAEQSSRLRSVIAKTLFDYPLPGGKRLGDANASEIRDGATSYERTAADAAHKARWLKRVAEKVGRKNKAENALTLAELEQIFEESRHEA